MLQKSWYNMKGTVLMTVLTVRPTMPYFIGYSLLLLFVVGLKYALGGNVTGEDRIIGGYAVTISNYPYQLSLQVKGSHVCGASIIGNRWAISAAHCCGSSATSMTVRAGSSYRARGGSLHQIAHKIVHPQYNANTADYDIALLKLVTPFTFGPGVAPIGLPAQNVNVEPGVNADVSGWGTQFSGSPFLPSQLQAVQLPVVSPASCKAAYGSRLTVRMICAGKGGKDACQGDSGGPMVVQRILRGITSFGKGCALPRYVGVFTNVAKFRDWIYFNSGI